MSKAIIIGASLAGLAIAKEMINWSIFPVILEPTGSIAGRPFLYYTRPHATSYNLTCVVGELYLHYLVQTIYFVRDEVCSVHAVNKVTGELTLFRGDYFYSSLPMHDLSNSLSNDLQLESPETINLSFFKNLSFLGSRQKKNAN